MSREIKINNKTFRKYIDEQQIKDCIKALSIKISKRFEGEELCFMVVLNGAFVFASDLVREITNECIIHFVKISSYEGLYSQAIEQKSEISKDLTGKNIIVIEDIIETGQTIDFLINQIRKTNPKSLEVCTLLYKPKKFKGDYEVNYVGMEIEDDFVVGYGMDFNQKGRNLKDIYQLK